MPSHSTLVFVHSNCQPFGPACPAWLNGRVTSDGPRPRQPPAARVRGIPVRSAHVDPGEDIRHRGARLGIRELNRFQALRWIGTIGSLLVGLGALGAGALPVLGNPYSSFPGGAFMARMLTTSSAMVLVGVGLLVLAWVLMGPRGAPTRIDGATVTPHSSNAPSRPGCSPAFTAPLFTQDIYSIAQSIVAAGTPIRPVDLLGPRTRWPAPCPSSGPLRPTVRWPSASPRPSTASPRLMPRRPPRILLGSSPAGHPGWPPLPRQPSRLWLGMLNPRRSSTSSAASFESILRVSCWGWVGLRASISSGAQPARRPSGLGSSSSPRRSSPAPAW